jgi:hypothetical protein
MLNLGGRMSKLCFDVAHIAFSRGLTGPLHEKAGSQITAH